jgi:hypothetical protein
MGKFIITEEERKHIRGLYEQSQTTSNTSNTQNANTTQSSELTNNTVETFDECFTSEGIPKEKIPQSCKSRETYGTCVSEMLRSELYKKEEWIIKVDAALDCMYEKLIK